jgi:hypothetical protein
VRAARRQEGDERKRLVSEDGEGGAIWIIEALETSVSNGITRCAGNWWKKAYGILTRYAFASLTEPQLSKLASKAPTGPQWIHEIKFDGYRMAAQIDKATWDS